MRLKQFPCRKKDEQNSCAFLQARFSCIINHLALSAKTLDALKLDLSVIYVARKFQGWKKAWKSLGASKKYGFRDFKTSLESPIFRFLARLQVQAFGLISFWLQERVFFAPTCHTSKTRGWKKSEMRFRGSFRVRQTLVGRLLARRLIKRILSASPTDLVLGNCAETSVARLSKS